MRQSYSLTDKSVYNRVNNIDSLVYVFAILISGMVAAAKQNKLHTP